MRHLAGTATLFVVALLAACGGGSSTSSPSTSPPPPSGSSGGGDGNNGVGLMRAVSVVDGQNAAGIDINVVPPATPSGPNAELLGVSELNAATTATNSGAVIHRGTTMKVILFGRGLSGNLRVIIGGPPDITVANVRSVTATDGTAGIAFDAVVNAAAALGARTVYLRSANDDITAFAGGLEVVP